MHKMLSLINNGISQILSDSSLLQDVVDFLNNNSDFVIEQIKNDASIVRNFPFGYIKQDLAYLYLRESAINHYVPTIDELENNPAMGLFYPIGILARKLNEEPRILMYFPEEDLRYYSSKYSFAATEEDLKRVPLLREIQTIMEKSIEENHSLLKYLKTDIDPWVIEMALEDIAITREDFLENPFLRTIRDICNGDNKEYYTFLSDEEKIVIVGTYINQDRLDDLIQLPFLSHEFNECIDEEIDVSKVIELIKSINPGYIDVEDNHINDNNWRKLSYLLDGIAGYRYKKNKQSFKYSSVVELLDRFEECFVMINEDNMNNLLRSLAKEMADFAQIKESDFFLSKMYEMYKIYIENDRHIPRESIRDGLVITSICNSILEFHKYSFVEHEKRRLRSIISETFELKSSIVRKIISDRKREKAQRIFTEEIRQGKYKDNIYTILQKDKIAEILFSTHITISEALISNLYDFILEKYDKTGNIDSIEIIEYLNSIGLNVCDNTILNIISNLDRLHEQISFKHYLRQVNYVLSDESVNEVAKGIIVFFIKCGQLSKRTLNDYLKKLGFIIEKNDACSIIRILNKEIIERSMNIDLTSEESVIRPKDQLKYNLEFVAKNYIMTYKTKTDFVLAKLLIELLNNPVKCKKAIQNIEESKELRRIVPFFGLIRDTEELSVNTLLDIVTYYSRIKRRLKLVAGEERLESNFEKIIGLAIDYGKSSDLLKTIIDPNVADVLGDFNLGKYAEFYFNEVYDRINSNIPIISGETSKYSFSSNFKDQERLIMGKMYSDSCFDLTNSSGVETFKECLIGPKGDLILVRDKASNELVGRVIALRRGNVVQLQLRNLDGSIKDNSIINSIGTKMMDDSVAVGDNLDIVVVATNLNVGERDDRLKAKFPHGDWLGFYQVVAKKNDDVAFDFDTTPLFLYQKNRNDIKENATNQELSMMKAMSIWLMPPSQEKEELKRSFEPVNFEQTGNNVIVGEDWYIIYKDGIISEEVVIPTKDNRQKNEINSVKAKFGLSKGGNTK